MRGKFLLIRRHALVKGVVLLWVLKGAYFYYIWPSRTFSSDSLDEGALNLGGAGLGLVAFSAAIVFLQSLVVSLWGLRGIKSCFSTKPSLSLALLIFSVTSIVGYAAGGGTDFWHYWLLFSFPFICVVANRNVLDLVLFCARAYGTLIIFSIIFYLLGRGGMAMPAGSTDLFPFPRLAGLTAHPNAMGATAAFVCVCSWVLLRSRERLFWVLVALAGLLLSQSKTATGAVVVALLVDWVVRDKPDFIRVRLQSASVAIAGLGALSSPLWVPYLAAFIGGEASTLTGRTYIWESALQLWRERWLIGYGPEIFDSHFRWLNRLSGAESAHNQTLETMVSSGLIGLGGLSLIFVAWVVGLKRIESLMSGRMATCLLILIFVRSISEATLNFVGPSITFVLFMCAGALLLTPFDCLEKSEGA